MYFKRILTLIAALAITGCAALQPDDGKSALERRVGAYYAQLVAGDYRKAYEYFSPGHRKRFAFHEHYQAYPPVARFEEARIREVDCKSDAACTVEMIATFVFKTDMKELDGRRITTTLPDRWVKVDGKWWLLPPR